MGALPIKHMVHERFAAGADAVQAFEAWARTLLAQADAHQALSSSLAHGDV